MDTPLSAMQSSCSSVFDYRYRRQPHQCRALALFARRKLAA
ncbi:hypothetical protein [Bradyrhizobium yuanmingense]|nr:hypothetical protein [Bradyrhizobium yuanmingense]